MKWEGLNLHLENLLPGVVTLFLLLGLIPQSTIDNFSNGSIKKMLESEVISGFVFAAAAYMLGAATVVVSRLIVDRLSERLPRPLLLRWLSRGQLQGLTRKQINEEYRSRIRAALAGNNEEVKKEVTKRRERGRLVRAALVPTILTSLVLASGQTWWLILVLIITTLIIVLLIYAYVEVTIYEECLLILQSDTTTGAVQLNPSDTQPPSPAE